MSRPLKTPPMGGPKLACGHGSADDISSVIKNVIESLGDIFNKNGSNDAGAEEPSGVISVTKKVATTTYEFDAESIAKTLVKVINAATNGFKWPEKTDSGDFVPSEMDPETLREIQIARLKEKTRDRSKSASGVANEPPTMVGSVSFVDLFDLGMFEGPDGSLDPKFVKTVVASLVKKRGAPTAFGIINQITPEKHRKQLLEALSEAVVGQRVHEAVKQSQEAAAKARAARDPIITPSTVQAAQAAHAAAQAELSSRNTPGGHEIVSVKTVDDEGTLKTLLPDGKREPFVEIQVDVGPNRPPAAFRGKTEEEAMEKADIALKRDFDLRDEGASDDENEYAGDMRDVSPAELG